MTAIAKPVDLGPCSRCGFAVLTGQAIIGGDHALCVAADREEHDREHMDEAQPGCPVCDRLMTE